MKINYKELTLAGVEAVAWYAFIYYLLFCIKNPVNLYRAAFILLVIMYVAAISCPIIRHTRGWKNIFGE